MKYVFFIGCERLKTVELRRLNIVVCACRDRDRDGPWFEDTGYERRVKVDKRQKLGSTVNLRVKEAEPFKDRLSFVQIKK